jgi:hypothetical protein
MCIYVEKFKKFFISSAIHPHEITKAAPVAFQMTMQQLRYILHAYRTALEVFMMLPEEEKMCQAGH